VPQNQTRAADLFQQAANRGDPEGMLDLGISYYSGAGVQRVPSTALRWLSRAAEFGFTQARDILGYMYEEGDGVAQSDANAIAWYRKSAVYDDPFAMTHLGVLLNGAEAVEWFRKAAATGYVDAEVNLATDYRYGQKGLPKDPGQVTYWYAKAAEKGDRFSMEQLGGMYLDGDGVTRDPEHARDWYAKAAEEGDRVSMVKLGNMYLYGDGVTRDPEHARQLYLQASGIADDNDIAGNVAGVDARQHLQQLNYQANLASQGISGTPDNTSVPNKSTSDAPGGLISPPPPPSNGRAAQQPDIGPQDNAPDPPHRPLPTQRSAGDNSNLKAAVILGTILIGAAVLLSRSDSSNSGQTSGTGIPVVPQNPDPSRGFAGARCLAGYLGC
jgi:TPR repeat protein